MKKIEDYLHLYLGCEVKIEGHPNAKLGAVGIRNGERVIVRWENDEWSYADVSEITPILRPLSSMTEEEAVELGHRLYSGVIFSNPHKGQNGNWRIPYGVTLSDYWEIDGKAFNQQQTIYLLSKGFDLFGLIEAGLAIREPNDD